MKKPCLLFIVLALVIMSTTALANGPLDGIPGWDYLNHMLDDGVVTWTGVNYWGAYDNVPMNRWFYYLDDNNGRNGQSVQMELQTRAYIPCYLELIVNGNQGKTVLQSFGPRAHADAGLISAYRLLFDNEIGGFVNESWNSLGHGRNAEIEPAPGVYIQGCDLFKVQIYANDNYKYEVKGGPLNPTSANVSSTQALDVLPLQMRSSVDGGDFGETVTFEKEDTLVPIIREKQACEESVVYHQFRVPYNRNVAHGGYSGTIILRAATL
ncbi:MAG: hypothetical protein GX050_05490 [Firmicutes bacterium]|nr:hypothetical protein [Bacillota bacterium]